MASFFAIIVFCLFNLSSARDTLLPGEFLYPNQSLISINGMFKFGFIESGDGNYTVGIWLTIMETENSELPLVQKQTEGVVWTANTENPLTKLQLSKVSVSQYGTFILTQSHSHIWSSDKLQNKPNCTKLVLLDTGNLVLQDQKNKTQIIWQSFYHPTDTWLPGAWLGYGTINGEKIGSLFLTSSGPSPWVYSLTQGGFGIVFKGKLLGSTNVAVKKLKIARQEEKQFRTEVQTIGMIQHANIVRLFGFCAEGANRLLVYEYMLNGSLDSHIFSGSSTVLSWQAQYRIALGTAKGLAYLHEERRDCIIHCDIKPENVLLDDDFSPKIADFGMAKLISREYSRALTRTRGTLGYLAPEWYSGQAITQKADVYSFGMLLLEVISGRRNSKGLRN